jgi:ABC-2 type transport system permease protein
MRSSQLSLRNLREVVRDPLSLGITVGLPLLLLPTLLTPGIVMFGLVMVMFSSAMILARDRETELFARLLTAPLRPAEFVAGYSLPYLAVAVAQALVILLIGALLGMDLAGSAVALAVIVALMAVFYVALGVIFGALLTVAQCSGAYAVVLILTIFGGTWFDLDEIGGAFLSLGEVLPFKHALDAGRAVLADGAGLGDVGGDLAWVAGYALAAVALAVVAFRRSMADR